MVEHQRCFCFLFIYFYLDKVNNETLSLSWKTSSWVGGYFSSSYSISDIICSVWRLDKSETEQTAQLGGLLTPGFHHMAIVEHSHWTRSVHTSCKTKRSHDTFISLNQPISNMCLPHGCSERLYEFVFLKSDVGKTCVCERKNTYQVIGGGWHPSDMFPFSTVLNSPLPTLRNMYLVLKRSHLTVVNTATEKKVCFLLCLISGVLSSEGGKKSVPFGNEFCVMLKAKASQRSEIKAEWVKLKTVIL